MATEEQHRRDHTLDPGRQGLDRIRKKAEGSEYAEDH